jgi:dTDP-4-amino-4,6-dideoxygalactose transaminase
VSERHPEPLPQGGREIRFVDLRAQTRALQPQLEQAIRGVIERTDFILGADVERFETEFAAYCRVPFTVGVDSGVSALELALRAAGVGPGDEVITQANTFIASVSAILAVGARPVLVDCQPSGDLDPSAIAAAITPQTRAVMPVHLFGRIGDIEAVMALGEEHGVAVIEDACQAHGAIANGRRAGTFGLAAAFSFYPGKNLGAFGDAGALVTSSPAIADAARGMRHYGQRVKYEHVLTPLNHRLDTIQAAILRVKLPHLDGWNQNRERLADAYRERLAGVPITVPQKTAAGRHVYHLFVIETGERDALKASLQANGIESGIHYPIPVHLQPALANLGYESGQFPIAERLASRSLSLPMYPELPLDDLERVTDAIRRYFGTN